MRRRAAAVILATGLILPGCRPQGPIRTAPAIDVAGRLEDALSASLRASFACAYDRSPGVSAETIAAAVVLLARLPK
jgi:hypothetical protein